MMTINPFKKIKARGFTLIEMMVAVLLLTLAIGGPLTITSKGLLLAVVAKDQTTAFYLAQDAVEFVRYARDTNALSGGNWLTGAGGSQAINLSTCINGSGTAKCYVDSISAAAPTTCGATCGPLYYNDTTKQFTYTTAGNRQTMFTRTVSITNPNGGVADEAVLRVEVAWRTVGGATRSVVVTESLFNWQQL